MGSHRHAFTVGFISMMILGVSSRVVPILAGVDSKRMNSLWAPFILLNLGCVGRVLLQVLTDFIPTVPRYSPRMTQLCSPKMVLAWITTWN